MKTFIIWDYKIQTFFILTLFVILILDFLTLNLDLYIIFYFVIAVNHIISSNRKFFSRKYSKSILFIIYYFISMLFLIVLLSIILAAKISLIDNFWDRFGVLITNFAVFGTPILAITYYLICTNDYRKINNK